MLRIATLPIQYHQVEYITLTGGAYIKLNYNNSGGYLVSCDLEVDGFENNY
jgi:hypothetical protein